MTRTPARPLPPTTRWAHRLWIFPYRGRSYFASELPTGWTVVAEDDQTRPLSAGHDTKAKAVRAAMQKIDEDTP
ncbi:hypothetical protein [Streptomyces sp. CS014]|uniref:hypothetical protein n=1 Tax=Streptomyces sp. CS014 TaxID=2162707 RepID=UPI000D50DC88|nr:hypothetical protein [Streptomyces sp. CS014]PVD04467.1 hypothetical protein DBP12_03310 [Streptomyces sp. CS014]